MEIGLVLGMLFLWTILTGLTVFLYRELSRTNKPEVRHVRVEIDPEQEKSQLRN
jgi:uncharacterized iron-regulated membrane protein